MKKLIHGVLDKTKRRVGFRVSDESLLYDELNAEDSDYDPRPLFIRTTAVEMYGRVWEFEVHSSRSFRVAASREQPIVILVGGILIDGLLLLLFLSMSRSSTQAIYFADAAKKGLKRANLALQVSQRIVEEMPVGQLTCQVKNLDDPDSFKKLGSNRFFDSTIASRLDMSANNPIRQVFGDDALADVEAKCLLALRSAESVVLPSLRYGHGLIPEGVFQIQAVPLDDRCIALMFSDVTLTTVAREAAQRTATELRRSNEDLQHFAYIASHDLKAPLRGIRTVAEWIFEDLEGRANKETLDHFSLVFGRIDRMEGLIEGILRYSRLDYDPADDSVVDLEKLALDLRNNTFSEDRKFSIQIVGSYPRVVTNEVALTQVLSNLLNNAVTHHDGSFCTIELRCKVHADHCEFWVSDDGPGIPDEYHQKVFQIFQTLKRKDDCNSTGIGLSLVKKLIDYNGGEISILSGPGRGTTFYFTWFCEAQSEDYREEGEAA